jgi:1-acyl-sn-glycerol-3-phosphate acyltransferase
VSAPTATEPARTPAHQPAWRPPRGPEWEHRLLRHANRLLLRACTRTRHDGLHHVPAAGPVLVAGNHLSVADGFVLADAVRRSGRRPRMMGTAGLFRAPVLGAVLRRCGFIPVHRRSATPASALAPASAALMAGECVTLYPEGAITRHEGAWPARGKTGVVRLALDTGAPVVPVAQWGTLDLVGPEGTRHRALLAPLRRPVIRVLAGEPLDLRARLGVTSAADASPEQLREGADLVMDALCALLEELRDGPRPAYAGRAANPPKAAGSSEAAVPGSGPGRAVRHSFVEGLVSPPSPTKSRTSMRSLTGSSSRGVMSR